MKINLKPILYGLLAIMLVVGAIFFLTSQTKPVTFGVPAEGRYSIYTTGTNIPVTTGPVILHRIIFGSSTDQVVIGDLKLTGSVTPGDNAVFNIAASGSGSVTLETVFNSAVLANVTSSNGVTFVTGN